MIKDILKAFGVSIRNNKINFKYMNEIESKEIFESINAYESYTLEKLSLLNCHGHVLDELQIFTKLDSLVFSTRLDKAFEFSDKEGLTLTKLFPNLRRLYLLNTKPSDWAFINGIFPKLSIFEVALPTTKTEYEIVESQIIEFIKSNTKINIIVLRNINSNVLKEISENLPNLKTMEIKSLSNDYRYCQGNAIHFEKLKELIFTSENINEIPENIFFRQLNKLTLNIIPEITDKWIELIKNQMNKHLKTFTLNTENLSIEHFLRLGETLTRTDRMVIHSVSHFASDDVVKFLEKTKHLHVLELDILMKESEQKDLENKISGNWTIEFTPIVFDCVKIYIQK